MSQAQMINELDLPGRLGDSTRILKTDSRSDPRLIAALAPLGLGGAPTPVPVTQNDTLQAKLEYLAATEAAFDGLFGTLVTGLPPITNVERRTETIRGQDGNEIKLYIHSRANATALCISRARRRDGHHDGSGSCLQALAR
jgi:acetyl esterase